MKTEDQRLQEAFDQLDKERLIELGTPLKAPRRPLKAFRRSGVDPSLDKQETINEKHLRRQLT